MKKFLLSCGVVAMASSMFAPQSQAANSIDDILGTYTGTIYYHDGSWKLNEVNVSIVAGEAENSVILKNVFSPVLNINLPGTYNPDSNTITIYEQYLNSDYYLFISDGANEYYESATLTIEGNEIYSDMEYFNVCYYVDGGENDVDNFFYGLDLEKVASAEPSEKYDINDVLGTYNGSYAYDDNSKTDVSGVIISQGKGDNDIVIEHLFAPYCDESINATFNPDNNTIAISAGFIDAAEIYYLYAYPDYYDYDNNEGTVYLSFDAEGNLILAEPQGLYLINDDSNDPNDGVWMEQLVLEKVSGSTETPGYTYDINDLVGTYTATAYDWYEDTDTTEDVTINNVTIELGEGENALIIKNLLSPVTNAAIHATFIPENNTIMIEEQWVDSNYYIYLYDSYDWLDEIYLTVYEDGTIFSGDQCINAYAWYNPEMPELYRGEIILAKSTGSDDEPGDEPGNEPGDEPGDDNPTVSVSSLTQDAQVEIYNLQGIRVSKDNLAKGLYIINGKKVLVK